MMSENVLLVIQNIWLKKKRQLRTNLENQLKELGESLDGDGNLSSSIKNN